jgi:hypothetical protein
MAADRSGPIDHPLANGAPVWPRCTLRAMIQPHVADAKWFWSIGGQKNGPVSLAALQAMVHAGQLGPQATVWTEGMAEWVAAGRLPVLFSPHGAPAPRLDHGGLGLLMPVGPQSGLSIAAGYCGLVGLLIPFAAPVGLVLGLYGLRDLKRHPEKSGRGRAITGIVLGGLLSLVWLIWLFAVVVALIRRH